MYIDISQVDVCLYTCVHAYLCAWMHGCMDERNDVCLHQSCDSSGPIRAKSTSHDVSDTCRLLSCVLLISTTQQGLYSPRSFFPSPSEAAGSLSLLRGASASATWRPGGHRSATWQVPRGDLQPRAVVHAGDLLRFLLRSGLPRIR